MFAKNMLEKPQKEINRKKCTFNMQKSFFRTWEMFNFLITKDDRVNAASLQKPDQFRSFIIRGLIQNYTRDHWSKFEPTEFEAWRRARHLEKQLDNKQHKKTKSR